MASPSTAQRSRTSSYWPPSITSLSAALTASTRPLPLRVIAAISGTPSARTRSWSGLRLNGLSAEASAAAPPSSGPAQALNPRTSAAVAAVTAVRVRVGAGMVLLLPLALAVLAAEFVEQGAGERVVDPRHADGGVLRRCWLG